MLGNGRLLAQCFDGKERLCHIRGKLRKKVWINTGDIILVGLRDYQESKVCIYAVYKMLICFMFEAILCRFPKTSYFQADVILKYTSDEARVLKNEGQLPESARLNENDEVNEGEVEFGAFFAGFALCLFAIRFKHFQSTLATRSTMKAKASACKIVITT